MPLKGKIKVDKRTKNLLLRIQPNEIAVIDHEDLDEMAARGLIKARVKAVLNARASSTGRYPNQGPLLLLSAGIPLVEELGDAVCSLPEDTPVEVLDNEVWHAGCLVATGVVLSYEMARAKFALGQANYQQELTRFAGNTIHFALQELDLIGRKMAMPLLDLNFQGRQVLIVVRGKNYMEDLKAVRTFIDAEKPILIGVDGGADALLSLGYVPHLIIGDMDSISDTALRCGAIRIVHSYPDGCAPGLARLQAAGLNALTLPSAGTSEDVAMLLAYERGARLIVAVGSHSNMMDFLEKGRQGMASTFLVRLKVGDILVDAKGVSELYHRSIRTRDMVELIAAALLPFVTVAALSPGARQLIRLMLIRLRLSIGL